MEKRLPLSFSSFEKIIATGCIYVDKTEYIYHLFYKKRYDYVFLSRPRRFGKTLFVDTLKQLFLGKKELFKDLWIYNSDYDWQVYPIIHIDFSTINKRSIPEIEAHLQSFIDNCANQYNVELKYYESLEGRFSYLIQELSKINKVVILIDEYDKPILDNLDDLAKAEKIRNLLKSFYEVVKGNDAYIRAFFMTGITKFGQMSIFSGLNNLNDISLDAEYAEILGYTQGELETYFDNYVKNSAFALNLDKNILLNEVKSWYNGYRFTKSLNRVYNPFSVLNFFAKNDFRNYWFDTGTPSFLVNLLKRQYAKLSDIKNRSFAIDFIGSFELKTLSIIPVMYQAGYLTIVDYGPMGFKLDYPNLEIEKSFNRLIAEALLAAESGDVKNLVDDIYFCLFKPDFDTLRNIFQEFLSTIPSELLTHKESYFNTIFHCIFSLVASNVQSQSNHFARRPDTIVCIDNKMYIFEFKLNKSAQEALDQIVAKKYYEPYFSKYENIYLVGVNIDTKTLVSVEFLCDKIK